MDQLKRLDDDIWTIPAPLKLLGMKINTRATVIRNRGDQSLWVHSPCQLSPALERSIAPVLERLSAAALEHTSASVLERLRAQTLEHSHTQTRVAKI